MTNRTLATILFSLLAGILIGSQGYRLYVNRNQSAQSNQPRGEELALEAGALDSLLASSAILQVEDQAVADTVKIRSVTLSEGGWVAIHENDEGQPRRTAFGAQWLPAGSYSEVEVELIRSTVAGKTYFAILHSDNGDKKFDSALDVSLKDEAGNPVRVEFSVQ